MLAMLRELARAHDDRPPAPLPDPRNESRLVRIDRPWFTYLFE